ncbi:MAG: hypothetical protein HY072_10420 [Deltaproteobacteria bacterium]|nr:hypothetical protein [Deltaproteobacteria bacterium]
MSILQSEINTNTHEFKDNFRYHLKLSQELEERIQIIKHGGRARELELSQELVLFMVEKS